VNVSSGTGSPGFPGQIPQSRKTVVVLCVQHNRLRWYGHVLSKEENDWVKNVWIMKWRVPGQEIDKENLERDCGKRLPGTWIEQGGCRGLY